MASAAATLADTHPLRLLSAAVAGRPVAISYLVAPEARAWSDGERIYLGAGRLAGEGVRELLVQCCLLAGDSLGGAGIRGLIGNTEARQRFLVLEVERCSRLIADRLPSPFLAALAEYASGLAPSSVDESLAIARSRARLPQPPVWYGTLKPWQLMRRQLRGVARPGTARRLEQLESRLGRLEDDTNDTDDDDLERNPLWKLLSSPLAKDGFFARFMREILDMRSSPEKAAAESGIEGSSEMVSGRAARQPGDFSRALRALRELAIPSALLRDEEGAHGYPEWDAGRMRYRAAWTSVEEVMPNAAEPRVDPVSLGAGVDRALQRALATLCLGFRRHAGQAQGERLMLDPMIRLAVDLRSGYSGDERIYSASLRTRRDLGVMILLDTSSSTLEASGGERVFDRQARAAWQLARAFELLGDRVAMYGFHSWGRTLVRFQHLKGFDERMGGETRARMSRLSVAGYTRSGAAIRHATHLLGTHSGMPWKLLLLVSDGYPYDDQYEGDYASGDTRKALDEARARGVACVCLSVGSDADAERLERAYGAANYLSLADAGRMALRLRAVLEGAIAQVARKRDLRPAA